METLNQTKKRLEAFISETYPEADVSPGSVLNELLLKLSATIQNKLNNTIEGLSQTNSVNSVLNSNIETYSEIIDSIASNYNVIRNSGRKSSGNIKVTVSTVATYLLPAGFLLTQSSLNLDYQVTSSIKTVSVNENELLNPGEVRLQTDGRIFYFIVPVEALNIGGDYQLTNGAKLVLGTNSNLTNFVGAEAYGNFSPGLNKETDRELITRFRIGLSAKTLVSQVSTNAKLTDVFGGFKGVSIVGANDPEMTRGKSNLFGFPTFGMADVYVRTANNIDTVNTTLPGVKISTDTWRIDINSAVLPGFYQVTGIIPARGEVSGTLEIRNKQYGFESGSSNRVNHIATASQARFSKYQTLALDFTYVSSLGLNEENFIVSFNRLPNIEEIQNLFLNDEERIASADYLVKAVIPCTVSVDIRLIRKSELDTVPTDNIKKDIFNYINGLSFNEAVSASRIVDICHNYNIKRVDLPVKMEGVILLPTDKEDKIYSIQDNDLLEIPFLTNYGVSSNNTIFFTSYFKNDGASDNIGISVI